MHSARNNAAAPTPKDETPHPQLRMRDLVRETGLPRETIHFYLAGGLLPRPKKTGRNTAVYGAEHVRRARLIKSIQEKHFLPLRAIRALLEDADDTSFSSAQRSLIKELRVHLGPTATAKLGPRVLVTDILAQGELSKKEIAELCDRGAVTIEGRGAKASVSSEDADLLRAWARLKAVGISPERGFMPQDLDIIEVAISRLARREIVLFTERYAAVGGEEAARVATEAVPIVNQIISILHWRRIRSFIAEISERDTLAAAAAAHASKRKNGSKGNLGPR